MSSMEMGEYLLFLSLTPVSIVQHKECHAATSWKERPQTARAVCPVKKLCHGIMEINLV